MKKIFFILIGVLVFSSCKKETFNIDNPNYPIDKEVLADPADFLKFNQSNHKNVFQAQVDLDGVFFRGMSDQFTATNAYLGFWTFTDEPRLQLPNTTNNDDLDYQIGGPWDSFNEVIDNSNIVLQNIIEFGVQVTDNNGNDITQQELAGAYFDKAIALGYLSMIYDKAFIVNYDTDIDNLQFSDYNDVLAASIDNFNNAINVVNSLSSFEYHVYDGSSTIDKTKFIQLANSYMARFSISVPRTDAEAQNLDYNAILNYANNGLDSNFYPLSKTDVFYNNLQDWSLYIINGYGTYAIPELGGGQYAGYMPTDIKIAHLFDPSYPVEYPTNSDVLPPANSNDPRLAYYIYVGDNFGYLRESRGRHLFSSYLHIRFWDGNNENDDGLEVQIFPKAEIDYIKAECYYRLGNYAQAVSVLDASPRGTVGNQTTTAAKDNVRNALFYEYSIELDLNSGMAVNWAFMRRHDLLQIGTATQYPVPASELEVQLMPTYTFGGESNAGQTGTASGANDWRNINLVY